MTTVIVPDGWLYFFAVMAMLIWVSSVVKVMFVFFFRAELRSGGFTKGEAERLLRLIMS